MHLKNFDFSQASQDPLRPSGPCEAGGHPAHCFFDRSGPGLAWVTLRFSMTPGALLPEFARGCEALVIAGAEVPVRQAKLKCGAGALQGSLDPALVEAVAGPVPDPASPGPDAVTAPAAGAGDPPPPSDPGLPLPSDPAPPARAVEDRTAAKLDAFRRAKAALAEAGESIAGARERAARLKREADAAASELAGLESSLKPLRAARADAAQALLDAAAAEVEEA